jgi:hypothetical protein
MNHEYDDDDDVEPRSLFQLRVVCYAAVVKVKVRKKEGYPFCTHVNITHLHSCFTGMSGKRDK